MVVNQPAISSCYVSHCEMGKLSVIWTLVASHALDYPVMVREVSLHVFRWAGSREGLQHGMRRVGERSHAPHGLACD